jgi:DNA-directed RNA polymerase specialized sigma24 family protein
MEVSATNSPERTRVRALSDSALVIAMRAGDDWAWAEFDSRFRARLEQYTRHVGSRGFGWDECITEVIEDAALKLTSTSAAIPTKLTAYLIRAVRNRARTTERAAARRHRRYVDASTVNAVTEPDAIVWSLCSESAIRSCSIAADDIADDTGALASRVRRQLGAALMSDLSDEEQCIVTWVAEVVPYRQIATWLGTSYDATSKRIWRLLRRLRHRALVHASGFNAVERAELERLFQRAGVMHVPTTGPATDRRGGNQR